MALGRERPISSRALAVIRPLVLLALSSCGRIGIAILPDERLAQERDGAVLEALDAQLAEAGMVPELPDDSGVDPPLDAQASEDAQLAVDARVATDTGAPVDATSARDASAPLEAAVDASDAAEPAPGVRLFVDYTSGSGTLNDYAVRVLLDTRSLIQQGQLAADCSNLRIFGNTGCSDPRSYFLPAYACNSAATEVWVRVPQLVGGTREVLAASFDGAGAESSSGARVFPFFDDFAGSALDSTRWIARGQGTLSVADGVLQGQGVLQIESLSSAVSAGQSAIGARLAMLGAYDTDVELGAGKVDSTTIWAPGRTWDGISFVSYSVSTYAFDGPAGSACDDLANSMVPPQLSATPWVDTPPATASFLTAEFAYANRSGRAEAWLRSSRGASLSYNAPLGCTLPAALPVMITLDHNAPDAPLQRIDYVYVRPAAASEPSTSVVTSSTAACGSTP